MEIRKNTFRDERIACRPNTMCVGFCAALTIFILFAVAGGGPLKTVHAAGESTAEARIVRFVKDIYPGGDAVRVRLTTVPAQLRGKVKIVNMSFLRIPDVSGDGICIVEIETSPARLRTVQVPFKVFTKRELYVLKQAGQKGDTIGPKDVVVRETYMNGKGPGYPASMEEIVGKVLKRDVPASTMITSQLLEDRIVVKRGDIVTITAESNRLIVRSKGRTVDKGRVGDMIRVKNITSGKEVMARIMNDNSVKVEF